MIKLKHEGSGEIFYATKDSVGSDITSNDDYILEPGKRHLFTTGLSIVSYDVEPKAKIQNKEIQIRPRSGLAHRYGISICNTPASIDPDYQGEIRVNLINFGDQPFEVKKGDRIAQGVCCIKNDLSELLHLK